jgi:CxxC motif-containing protein (DUF1111 family)
MGSNFQISLRISVVCLGWMACFQLGWSDIHLTLHDSKNAGIPGVSCSEKGSPPGITDGTGALVLNRSPLSIEPILLKPSKSSLTRIPLGTGEKAILSVRDIKGKNILQQSLSLGESVNFPGRNTGLFIIDIATPHTSFHGRLMNIGQDLRFETMRVLPGRKFAANGGDNLTVTCSKSGYSSQVYQIADGATLSLDFTKMILVPLFDNATKLEPDVVQETDTALITRFNDRGRDRHAREFMFHIYDHYLSHYWIHRTAQVEIVDKVAKGGKEVIINVTTLYPLTTSDVRTFYQGEGTLAQYYNNDQSVRDPTNNLKYKKIVTINAKEKRPLKIGDKIEIEVSQFFGKLPEGEKFNYYGTVVLYIVGSTGMVPWENHGGDQDKSALAQDSWPADKVAWEGGWMTLPKQMSNEPLYHFIQMAPNIAPENGQKFMLGRRVFHSDFVSGLHDEPQNDSFPELKGKAGPNFVNTSCNACHNNNGRALPPALGKELSQYVVKVGDGNGNAHPKLGGVLQPKLGAGGMSEGSVNISGWTTETNGLRKPIYAFTGTIIPTQFSARISPQLVGMGLLEAIPEADIQALADPEDLNHDGISGRMRIVSDYDGGVPHLGRFGWKAGKPSVAAQTAGALNTDMGVATTLFPNHDCGSAQTNCGSSGSELADTNFSHLVDYVTLLGVSMRKDYKTPVNIHGEELFANAGCTSCHTPTMVTGPFHPKAEVRNQTIHPFTDLLLHDMGPGLADNLPEGDATGAEWRTPPLWNIGYTARVSSGEAYLHDGRARTLEEAIKWHGGEGTLAAKAFEAMSVLDAAALISFLKSL